MADLTSFKVRFEPVGVEMDVHEGETVLDAAFRQGISVMHGCKEGQCASCKSVLVDGDAEMLKYSTFALPESERDTNHILLCRTLAFSDLTVEFAELRRRPDEPLNRGEGFQRDSGFGGRAYARHPHADRRACRTHALLGRPVCRPEGVHARRHTGLFHGQPAKRRHPPAIHHQAVSKRGILRSAGTAGSSRATPSWRAAPSAPASGARRGPAPCC